MAKRRVTRVVALVALVGALASITQQATAAPVRAAQAAGPFDSDSVFCSKHSAPAGRRNASAPGVTPSSITMTDASLDTEALRRLGSDQMNFSQAWRAYWDEVNKCGGINGRKVIVKTAMWNALAPDQAGHQQAICLKATEDHKSLIMFGIGTPNIGRCVSVNHRTITVANTGVPSSEFRDSRGRIISIYPAGDKLAEGFIKWGHRDGLFKGKKIGVLGSAQLVTNAAETKKEYEDDLQARGYDVAATEVLPCTGQVCTQGLGSAVSRMRARGVNLIVLTHHVSVTTMGSIFRELRSQGLRAPVYGPDTDSANGDNAMPNFIRGAGSDGAQAAAQNGWYALNMNEVRNAWRVNQAKDTPFARMCTATLAKALKQRQYQYNPTDIGNSRWGGATTICTYVRDIARAIHGLGNTVTTDRLVAAFKAQRQKDNRDTGKDFRGTRVWYMDRDVTPSFGTLAKLNFPCPLPTPGSHPACFLPVDRPARVIKLT